MPLSKPRLVYRLPKVLNILHSRGRHSSASDAMYSSSVRHVCGSTSSTHGVRGIWARVAAGCSSLGSYRHAYCTCVFHFFGCRNSHSSDALLLTTLWICVPTPEDSAAWQNLLRTAAAFVSQPICYLGISQTHWTGTGGCCGRKQNPSHDMKLVLLYNH